MKFAIKCIGGILAALVIGVGSALGVLYFPLQNMGIKNGAWRTSLTVGSPDAGMYQRAYVARVGLFALNKTETIYYQAYTDENDDPLRSSCDYIIEGGDIDARWWAITLYGEDHFLIPNDRNRHSYNMKNLERDQDGTYRIYLSSTPKKKNWLPSGEKDHLLSMSLRLYNPAAVIYEEPEKIDLPRIIKESCR
jgi:hypothetical protein